VTGGARGIGRCIAETLTRLGASTAVGDLQPPTIDGVLGLELDVTREEQVDAVVSRVERELGQIELLVLNAGIFRIESLEETTLSSWHQVVDVNLTGAFLCARRVVPSMRAARFGRIVAIGSSAGVTGGTKNMAAYAASKAGIMVLAKSIASQYAPFGITSNALAPSLIETDMITDLRDLRGRVPVGRFGQPQEVADLVAFLCSAHAAYITGEVVDINGGILID
jgi:3-oxoacyl-[acyl-carrier protein] reductase